MYLSTSELIWSLVIFAGVVQGALVSGFLLSKRRSQTSRLFGWLSVTFTLMMIEALLDVLGLFGVVPHTMLLTAPAPLAIGPLLLFTARSLCGLNAPKGAFIHFIPLLLAYVALIPFYIQPADAKLSAWSIYTIATVDILVVVKLTHLLIYHAAAIRLIRTEALAPDGLRRWFLYWILFSVAMVIIIHVWHFAASAEVNALVDSDKIGSLILAASCYFIGSLIVVRPALLEPSDGPQIPSYRTSRLTPNELSSLADQLESFVRQNEAFRNPALSLEDLAEGVGTTAHTLSQVLSQAFDINFYGYINAKRVEAVIETFAEERHRDVPLMHIATDCGFNSKSSFYRAFKAHTGTTPSAFRESSQIARKAGPN